MTAITTKPLPHQIGSQDIINPELKRITMLFMENFKLLASQVATLQRAVTELQRKEA